jgi:hypothetical protein
LLKGPVSISVLFVDCLAFPACTGHNGGKVISVKLHGVFQLIVAALIAAALAGCGGGGGGGSRGGDGVFLPPSPPIHTVAEAQQHAQWTVLVYLDADNDLEAAGIHNFNQMEVVGSTRDVHVIVQMDRRSGTDPNNERWTDTRRYLIIQDSDPLRMHSIRLDTSAANLGRVPPLLDNGNLGELDMADPKNLRDFVQWGIGEFPADHYALVIWDHGTGWQIRSASVQPEYKYIAADDTSSSVMNITDIPRALAGFNIDVIAFDACYMQQLELAYELRGSAHYLVASTAVEPSAGYNYARILSQMTSGTDPEQMARLLVAQYAAEYPDTGDITQSAIDLTRAQDVAMAASIFANVLETNAASKAVGLAAARSQTLDYATAGSVQDSRDLGDYASRCAAVIGSDASLAYTDLKNALSAAVIASIHGPDMPNDHGMAIYIPPPTSYDPRYGQLSLARDTGWDDWLVAQHQ